MTVQIIRGSCRHALGRMVQTVVSFSCVEIVSLLFKLQLLRTTEILYTEQVEQTQQFTCCLADTQQTGSSLLPADSAFLRGDLQACVLVRCSLKALSSFLRCRQIPHCSSRASSYIFHFLLYIVISSLCNWYSSQQFQLGVSSGQCDQKLLPLLHSGTCIWTHTCTEHDDFFFFFFRKSCMLATPLCFLRISLQYLIKTASLFG